MTLGREAVRDLLLRNEYCQGNYNEGGTMALVAKEHEGGRLDLIYFPTSSPVEHANDIPPGTGGRTWQPRS